MNRALKLPYQVDHIQPVLSSAYSYKKGIGSLHESLHYKVMSMFQLITCCIRVI